VTRIITQRFFLIVAVILADLYIIGEFHRYILKDKDIWLFVLASIVATLVTTGLGVMIDYFLNVRKQSKYDKKPISPPVEIEFFQLNQELVSRAQEQSNELSRLNVELQLQIAMQKKAEELAHTNEERFRCMADNIQDGLTIIENGRLVYFNNRAFEIFGDCPNGELQSRILRYASPEEQPRLREILSRVERKAEPLTTLEYWIISQDNNRRCIRERFSNSSSNGITRTFIVTSDVTEAVQAYHNLETAVSERTRELSTVLDISRRIATTLELEPLLQLILDQIQSVIPYTGAAIFTLEDGKLDAVTYRIPGMPIINHHLNISLDEADLYRRVIDEKEVLILKDIHGDLPLLQAFKNSIPNAQLLRFNHARSWIGIPFVVRDRVIGLLSLTYSKPSFYQSRHARLAMTIANQVAVAIENARLYEQAQNLAALDERHRIARELHDSVTQLLYGICLYCTATSRSLRSSNYVQVEENLNEIKDDALQALQEMRLLILELDPPILQKAGLVAALQSSLGVIETRTGLETELKVEQVADLPQVIEMELYRIAIEALNNLVRYARAKKVTVELHTYDSRVYMEICDNGVGFDLSQAKRNGGMGLHNMEQRVQQIGGKLDIHSNPGKGSRICVDAPLTLPQPSRSEIPISIDVSKDSTITPLVESFGEG
jgi:PAS domain S-box-containing protein